MNAANPAYLVCFIAALSAAAPFLSSLTDRQREKALDRYARQVNLALTPEVRPRVVRRIIVHERASMIGGITGAVLGLPIGLTLPQGPDSAVGDAGPVLAVVIGLAVGMTVATVIAAVVSTLRSAPGRRIARPTAPNLKDYVPALELWFTPLTLICAGLALAGAVIALATGVLDSPVLGPDTMFRSSGAILFYAALATYLIGRVLVRRVLDAGQPASSEQELAWDDALRAATLRGVIQMPAALAGSSVAFTFFEMGARTVHQPMIIEVIGVLAFMIFLSAVLVLIVLDQSNRPRQHYWRQLWQTVQPAGVR